MEDTLYQGAWHKRIISIEAARITFAIVVVRNCITHMVV